MNTHEVNEGEESVPPTEQEAVRRQIELEGVDSLYLDELTTDDLDKIAWSGGPAHTKAVAESLERAARGEVDYLAVRSRDGKPVSIGGVDYTKYEGKGVLWQLATMEELRGLGIGTKLVEGLEGKIRSRGLNEAVIGVEDDNPRAQALYERLGYETYGTEEESWEEQDEDGKPFTYHAHVILMQKNLET